MTRHARTKTCDYVNKNLNLQSEHANITFSVNHRARRSIPSQDLKDYLSPRAVISYSGLTWLTQFADWVNIRVNSSSWSQNPESTHWVEVDRQSFKRVRTDFILFFAFLHLKSFPLNESSTCKQLLTKTRLILRKWIM